MSQLINRTQKTFRLSMSRLIIFFSVISIRVNAQWTDPVLSPGVTPIKVVHVNELRTQINAKLVLCGQPTQAWTDPVLVANTTQIKKVHIDELRLATTNLVNAYRINQALPPLPPVYTDAVVVAKTTPIKASHIQELRGYVAGANCTLGCPAQALTWTVGGNACSAAAPSTAVGSSASVTDAVVPVTGTAQFNCNVGGVWAALPNVGATCSSSCCWARRKVTCAGLPGFQNLGIQFDAAQCASDAKDYFGVIPACIDSYIAACP